jgi:dipeptidase
MEHDLPFILRANRKISIEDVKFVLSSHFENTEFDPYGSGDEDTKKLFRSIGLNRNHHVHLLQIRNHVPEEIKGIHWLAFGANTFNTLTPFYANVTDTPVPFRDATDTFDLNNMYWLSCTTALLGDTDYDLYVDMRNNKELDTMAKFHQILHKTDKKFAETKDEQLLQQANEELSSEALARQTELLGKMVIFGSERMKLRYNFND